ncbi:MAG: hypothetical protein AB8F78_18280 [Saprospiraceae bacterium]
MKVMLSSASSQDNDSRRQFDFDHQMKERLKWYNNSWIDFSENSLVVKIGETQSRTIPYKELEKIKVKVYRHGEYAKTKLEHSGGSHIVLFINNQEFKYFLNINLELADQLIGFLKEKNLQVITWA